MEISILRRYGTSLVIKADNVVIEEDIEERNYEKDENGKINFKSLETDIDKDFLDMVNRCLDDMIEYRKAAYDSSDLIKRLLEKLPKDKIKEMYEHIKREAELYGFMES